MATMTGDQHYGRVFPRLQWGPVITGVLVSLACAVILELFGAAIGFAADASDSSGLGTLGAIWSVFTPFVSTLLGAWVCVRMCGYRDGQPSYLHGFLVWSIGLLACAVFLSSAALGAMNVNTVPGRMLNLNRHHAVVSTNRVHAENEMAAGSGGTFALLGLTGLISLAGAFAGSAIGMKQDRGEDVFRRDMVRRDHDRDYGRVTYRTAGYDRNVDTGISPPIAREPTGGTSIGTPGTYDDDRLPH